MGRDSEELVAVFPVDISLIHQAQIGFMYQCGCLESVVASFLAEIVRCQSA
jgi:hypothetical protein